MSSLSLTSPLCGWPAYCSHAAPAPGLWFGWGTSIHLCTVCRLPCSLLEPGWSTAALHGQSCYTCHSHLWGWAQGIFFLTQRQQPKNENVPIIISCKAVSWWRDGSEQKDAPSDCSSFYFTPLSFIKKKNKKKTRHKAASSWYGTFKWIYNRMSW